MSHKTETENTVISEANGTHFSHESLEETKRKQSSCGNPTDITGSCLTFFSKVELLCREELTHANLVKYGKYLYSHASKSLLHNQELPELWVI